MPHAEGLINQQVAHAVCNPQSTTVRCLFVSRAKSLESKPSNSVTFTPYFLTHPLHGARVLLEQLTGLQLVKKFPAFHGTRKFITALTSVRHLSLSWASPFQSIYPHPTSWRSILILFTHLRLGLPSGLFLSSFPTKTLYTPLSSPIRATCPAHLILLDFITRTILVRSTDHLALRYAVSSIRPLHLPS